MIDVAPGEAEGRAAARDVLGRPDHAAGGDFGAKAVVLGPRGAA
ncbi:hypothetical protein [Pseudonocardia sp. WMMC193]|nr:hypothetical protein [Pseudonocardia sp. WMMC193]